jgi:hypothetical protein
MPNSTAIEDSWMERAYPLLKVPGAGGSAAARTVVGYLAFAPGRSCGFPENGSTLFPEGFFPLPCFGGSAKATSKPAATGAARNAAASARTIRRFIVQSPPEKLHPTAVRSTSGNWFDSGHRATSMYETAKDE